MQKDFCSRILVENSGDEADPGVETGLQATVSTPVTFVTFTRLLRISLRALLHKFNLVFFHTFPASFKMPADVDCVYRVCNGQSGCCYLFAQNIHRLNSISEF